MNGLEAQGLQITGSRIELTQGASFHGTDMVITGDILVSRVHALRPVEPLSGNYMPNRYRKPWTKSPPTNELNSSVFGFSNLSARDIRIEQSLIDGPVSFQNVKARNVALVTNPPQDDVRTVRGTDFCIVAGGKRSDYIVQHAYYQGGQLLDKTREWPASEEIFPTCYGSLLFQGGAIEGLAVATLASDVALLAVKVERSLSLQGRFAGVVNLGNLQMKEGVVNLGVIGAPVIWCEGASLMLDGARIHVMQADRASFLTSDCVVREAAQENRAIGALPVSLRGAQIDRHLGLPRISMDEPANPGLLGLNEEHLKEMVSPKRAAPPLMDRISDAFRTSGVAPRPVDATHFDPQALAQLSRQLKDNGYTAEATSLTIERISRQKWESANSADRLKWMLGWPISWGYQVEWGFIYAFVLLALGTSVANYYRVHPARSNTSPPDPPWPPWPAANRARTRLSSRRQMRAIRWLKIAVAAIVGSTIGCWFQTTVPLTSGETLAVTAFGIVLLISAVVCAHWIIYRDSLITRTRVFISTVPTMFNLHSIFFSTDRFLPGPGLHSYWGNYPRIGQSGRNYFYFHRLAGLVLVSIVAAGFAGLFD
jgi:hypothetical protein